MKTKTIKLILRVLISMLKTLCENLQSKLNK